MSQSEIIDFLKKEKNRWWYSHEISFFCILRDDNCSKSLKKLREYGEIDYKEIPKNKRKSNGRFIYKFKNIKEEDFNGII